MNNLGLALLVLSSLVAAGIGLESGLKRNRARDICGRNSVCIPTSNCPEKTKLLKNCGDGNVCCKYKAPVLTPPPTHTVATEPTRWWACNPIPTSGPITPLRPTSRPPCPIPTAAPQICGVRGPIGRNINIRTTNVIPNGAITPFIEDMEYGGRSVNDTIYEEDERNRKAVPFAMTKRSVRITFGTETGPREHPWQVALNVSGVFHCGASLISDQHVLTAAHCVTKYKNSPVSPRKLSLSLGDWDLSTPNETANVVSRVERVTVHPHYSRITLQNDLAVLKLTKKIQFADNIRPICLAPSGFDPTNKTAIVTGWGRDENNQLQSKLQELTAKVTTNAYCARQWEEVDGISRGFITNAMMCMSPIGGDSCNGDSGGPSVINIGGIYYQVGIVSFGSRSCVDKTLPGVYTKVTKYRDWIMAQMN